MTTLQSLDHMDVFPLASPGYRVFIEIDKTIYIYYNIIKNQEIAHSNLVDSYLWLYRHRRKIISSGYISYLRVLQGDSVYQTLDSVYQTLCLSKLDNRSKEYLQAMCFYYYYVK